MNPSNEVLHAVQEKETSYTDDQKDPDVVQPYAAYSPPGNVQVKCSTTVLNHIQKLWISVSNTPQRKPEAACTQIPKHTMKTFPVINNITELLHEMRLSASHL